LLLNNYTNRNELLIDWLLETVPAGSRILDVGANDGSYCPQVKRIALHAGSFAGVDPDIGKLSKNPLVHERFPSTLETADIPANSFDCVYAIYVLEHVKHHIAFMASVVRVLKPGGSFFFITPNGYHYFAAIAGALAKLNLQERVLRMIRPEELVDDYHYPALYKLNRSGSLKRLGRQLGFSDFEFRYSERLDEVSCYFPGRLKVLPKLWESAVNFVGCEPLLCNLMGRMIKAPRRP
jgi:SAM-dependent methyltransferase